MHFLSRKRDPHRLGRVPAIDSKHKQPQQKSRPRLERRNAVKYIDYQPPVGVSWSSSTSEDSSGLLSTRSLDLPSSFYSNQTSFRIGGSIEGEVEILCRSLGLSGPEDFAIPISSWEARKTRSASDILPRSNLLKSDVPTSKDSTFASGDPPTQHYSVPPELSPLVAEENTRLQVSIVEDHQQVETCKASFDAGAKDACSSGYSPRFGRSDGGIRGVRPPFLVPPLPPTVPFSPPFRSNTDITLPVLKPLPAMHLPAIDGPNSSSCEEETGFSAGCRKHVDYEDDEDGEEVLSLEAVEDDSRGIRLWEISEGLFGTSSYSTMNDNDTSSTTTETMFVISPNGRFRTQIKSWMKGACLGSGSYGTVYEGISDEGIFFALKEVSLLDQGTIAQQCILQLEQEIALLSQFEHENIVRYFGTDKNDSKFFIFLELVTQGSLASLYQKYRLRDTQVSAYTRQILNGLNYLHERNVVHRDIKCANILVHANGSVKLADFGLAKQITKFSFLKSCKGSAYWMAPEVVQARTHGHSADIWSLGCTVLEMLTRQIPYPNLEWQQAIYKIGHGEPPPIPNNLSGDARDFISRCVIVNPDDRPTALQLLDHPFIRRSLRVSPGSNSSLSSVDRWS